MITKKKSSSAPKKTKQAGPKNRLGVKNSLVNNINARKKKGISRSKKKTTIARKQYNKMQQGWE